MNTQRRFVSDLHFAHPKVANLRGFDTAEAHDRWLIELWLTSVPTRGTEVHVLGDISAGGAESENRALTLLDELPGEKHLVLGNHERGHPLHKNGRKKLGNYARVFASVTTLDAVSVDGTTVMLSHFPYGSRVSFVAPGPEWRPTGTPGYTAHTDGVIRGKYGRALKPWVAGAGYEYVSVMEGTAPRNRTVHSLVCEAFHGPRPEGMQAAHNDGNKLNNRASNLRWATPQGNNEDKYTHGTLTGNTGAQGEANGHAKLSASDVTYIRDSAEDALDLATHFGVTRSAIYKIRNGRTWTGTPLRTAALVNDHMTTERYGPWRPVDTGHFLACGHVHDAWPTKHRMFNVGVDIHPTSFITDNVLAEFIGNTL